MADATYHTTTRVPVGTLWAFVQDMDNWARFVTGYQHHEKKSDTESVWTLKGDLGVMSRTLTFEVLITEWNGPHRVRFALRGVNEPMNGEGAFVIDAGGDTVPGAAGAEETPPPPKGPLARWLEALARWFLGLAGGKAEREAPRAEAARTGMAFSLRLDPGGPMAPMVNAMIKPLILPAAEQLADKILAHLEGRPAEAREGAPR